MEENNYVNHETTIRLASKKAQIEELSGRRKFYLEYDKSSFFEYEKRMLSDSECPHTLPMHFLSEEGKETAYYDFTEFIQLEEYIRRKSYPDDLEIEYQALLHDALDILSRILQCLKGLDEYLLSPNRISLESDTIFISLNNDNINLVFIPNRNNGLPLQGKIIALIETIRCFYHHSEVEQCIERFIELIYQKNLGLDGMIATLGNIQREVGYIYWNKKDFRKVEVSEPILEERKNQDAAERCGNDVLKESFFIKKPNWLIALVMQSILVAGLLIIFYSRILEITDFAGLLIIAAGADLWLMKSLHYV